MADATHDIRDDENDEKSSKDHISLIDMGPGRRSEIKYLRRSDHLVENH